MPGAATPGSPTGCGSLTTAEIVQISLNRAFNSGFGHSSATSQATVGKPEIVHDVDGKLRPWATPNTIFAEANIGSKA